MNANHTYVTRNEQLLAALDPYINATQISFDIETTFSGSRGGPMGSHGAIRLLQLGLGGQYHNRQLVVDLFHVDPTPIFAILENPAQEILIHNARFEVAWLLYQYGIEITNIFDTCAVWRHIQKLRRERKSRHEEHGNDLGVLADRLLSEHMNKANQTSDWSRPILSDDQIEYAAYDVAILPPLVSKTLLYMRRENIARDAMRALSNDILTQTKEKFAALENIAETDHHTNLHIAIRESENIDELELVWQSRRSLSLYHANREELSRAYQAKSRELTKQTVDSRLSQTLIG